MSHPVPAGVPAELHLSTLLPCGGIAVQVGAINTEWREAVAAAVGRSGRVLSLSGGEILTDSLDSLCRREQLPALHLLLLGPLVRAGRVLPLGDQSISRFGPAIVLLGGLRQQDAIAPSLLESLHYQCHRLHDELMVLMPGE